MRATTSRVGNGRLGSAATGRIALILAGTFLLASCFSPLLPETGDREGTRTTVGTAAGQRTGSLAVTVGETILASTIAPPDLTNVATRYDVTLTDPNQVLQEITENDYTPGTAIEDIPAQDWSLSVSVYQGQNLIGTGTPAGGNPITVSEGMSTNIAVHLSPQSTNGGNGSVDFSVDFSAEADQVDQFVFSIDPLPAGGGDTTTLVSNSPGVSVDLQNGSFAYTAALDSGTYLLRLALQKSGNQGTGQHPPIYEIPQVYDNPTSSKAITIQDGELNAPPTAPADLSVSLTGDN
mgnify:FL=1